MQGVLRKEAPQQRENTLTPEERYRIRVEFASHATQRVEDMAKTASQRILERAMDIVKEGNDQKRR